MRKSVPAASGFEACDTGLHSRPATLTKKRFDEVDDPEEWGRSWWNFAR
jgi:hypothetical protein